MKAAEGWPASYGDVAWRFRRVFRRVLPEQVLYAVSWYLGLRVADRTTLQSTIAGLAGVGALFDPKAKARPDIDERMVDRQKDDPPEFVPVFHMGTAGERLGLWFDEAARPSRVVTRTKEGAFRVALARGNAVPARTLIEALDTVVVGGHGRAGSLLVGSAIEREKNGQVQGVEVHPVALGGMESGGGTFAPSTSRGSHWFEKFLASHGIPVLAEDFRTLLEDDATKKKLVKKASEELDGGDPHLALLVLSNLHRHGDTRANVDALLERAYRRMGRHHSADMLRAARASEPVTGAPKNAADWALVTASRRGDEDKVKALMGAASADAHFDALLDATSEGALRALVEHAPPEARTAALAAAVDRVQAAQPTELVKFRAVAVALLEIAPSLDGVLEPAFGSGDAELVAALVAKADLAYRDVYGRSVLHIAALHADEAAVVGLLARGADPEAKDEHGATPYEYARKGWQLHPAKAGPILERLAPRTTPPPKVRDGFEAAEKAAHPKFGEGVVESVSGTGPEQKVTIVFESGKKVLMAKFLTLVG